MVGRKKVVDKELKRLLNIMNSDLCSDESKIDTSHVQILNKVKIKNIKNSQQVEYTLVSESEADIKSGKISVATPIAKGLLGKEVGDVVEIKVPSGVMSFEIMEISL